MGTYDYAAQNSSCAEGALDSRPHAVTSTVGATTTLYCYDQNGNMTRRDPSGAAVYNFQYDAESRMVAVSGSATASFVFDGDGNRVKSTAGGVTRVHIGAYFEWTGSTSTMKKYYYAGGVRVAMRTGTGNPIWLMGDHLGSTSTAANYNGTLMTDGEVRYKAWGEKRYPAGSSAIPTTYRYTGQRQEKLLGGVDGLYFYNARWYDPSIMRWTSPDPIIPGVGEGGNANAVGCLGAANYSPLTVDYHENQLLEQLNHENSARLQYPDYRLPPVPTNSIAFDRYAYSLNNPIRYTDPSGHCPLCVAVALTLGTVTPVGWVAIGITFIGVGIYIAAGGPEAVTNGLTQATDSVVNSLDALLTSRYKGDPRTAGEIIGQEKQGRINKEFPSGLLDKTYDEIVELTKSVDRATRDAARTAKKLLDKKEYDKEQKR